MDSRPAEEAAARRDPSRIDFTGQIEIRLDNATYGGHHKVILTADTIDWATAGPQP